MKSILSLVFALFMLVSHAQPLKQWTKIFGGNLADICYATDKYNDTMLISVGRSQSTNLGNKGLDDFMFCHFKPNGDLISIKTFGGPAIEQANAFVKLPNGNLIVGGNSSGKGGDVTEIYGLSDAWVMGYDPHRRVKLWDKNFGGSNTDQLNDMLFLENGKVFLFGNSKSADRDVPSNKGGADIWINNIDENGVAVRFKTFGGSKDDFGRRIIRAEATGGQILLFGESESNDGDFAGLNKGKKDIFIIKLNRNLNTSYITNMGTKGDDIFGDAVFLPDGSFIMFNTVDSTGGDVTDSLKGGKDIWMVKVNSSGKKVWSKIIGGSRDDIPVKASLYNQGSEIILMCTSASNDKDLKGNYGQNDVVIIKMDTVGNIKWTKNYGGNRGETAGTLLDVPNDGIYFVAQSFSTTNDLPSTNTQASDFWTVKIFECISSVNNINSNHCIGDTITIHSKKYYASNNTGIDTLKGMNSKGCDSILVINLTFNAASSGIYMDSLCNDAQVSINNVLFDKNKTTDSINFKGASQFGCDSLVFVNLFFAPEITVKDSIIKKDDNTGTGSIRVVIEGGVPPYSYNWSNGATVSQINNLNSGTYTLTVTDELDCVQVYSFRVGNTVSTSENEWDRYYKLEYYNKNWMLSLLRPTEIATIQLYTAQGKLVWQTSNTVENILLPEVSGISVLHIMTQSGIQLSHKIYSK